MTDIPDADNKAEDVGSARGRVPIRPIRKAYEQVADQIQEMVLAGVVASGARLPTEAMLAQSYGVSRSTIREALRVLSAQNLIRTEKGATGGSFVTVPTVADISGRLSSNIGLLTEAHGVTLEELLEARELIEVPAARLAAERAGHEELAEIQASIPSAGGSLNTAQHFHFNRGFHSAVIDTCRNRLLVISAQPIFSVLQTRLARTGLSREFHEAIRDQHVGIASAIDEHDGDQAAKLMLEHLQFLRPFYEQAWKEYPESSVEMSRSSDGRD
jgi:DNA-binding FadR family transcriptional regulator